jgi:AcrR family transcriptional regulator
MEEKKHRTRAEFRRIILDAARELFSADGYASFSMRKLAARIGYSPTTIYLYFQDKDEVLFCLCEELYGELFAKLHELRQRGESPLSTLRDVMLMYVRFGLTNPEHYKVVFFTNSTVYGSPQGYMETDTMSRRTYFYFRDLVAECGAVGQLLPQDADLQAQTLWAGMHGIVTAAIFTRDFPLVAPELLAETMIAGMLRGLHA